MLLILAWGFNLWYQPPPPTAQTEKEIEHTINSHKIVIYSKTYCPFCDQTKHLLNEQYPQESYEVINLNILDDGLTIQNQLYANTGQYMVPIIFINGQHVGGNSEVQQLHTNGKLQELLNPQKY
ncbi:hypothetical protein GWM34_02840, partial [Candida africana]